MDKCCKDCVFYKSVLAPIFSNTGWGWCKLKREKALGNDYVSEYSCCKDIKIKDGSTTTRAD